jgi:hypothetical protein
VWNFNNSFIWQHEYPKMDKYLNIVYQLNISVAHKRRHKIIFDDIKLLELSKIKKYKFIFYSAYLILLRAVFFWYLMHSYRFSKKKSNFFFHNFSTVVVVVAVRSLSCMQ